MKQTKAIIAACQVLRARVRFRDAGFSMDPKNPFKDDTQKIRDVTEIFVESWIIPIIDAIETGDTAFLQRFNRNDLGEKIGPR